MSSAPSSAWRPTNSATWASSRRHRLYLGLILISSLCLKTGAGPYLELIAMILALTGTFLLSTHGTPVPSPDPVTSVIWRPRTCCATRR